MFGIGFLNSAFLFALGAGVLPVLIHLLNRRRTRRIRFSTLAFIEETSRRRMRKLNLRRILVLVLRTLAVLFLVLAFARPTVRGFAAAFLPGRGPIATVICIDVSYSMGTETEGGTLLDLAKEIAGEIVDQGGENDVMNLVAFSSSASVAFEEGTRSKARMKDAIAALEPSQGGTDVAAAVQEAVEALQRAGTGAGAIYVVSDFTGGIDSTWTPPAAGGVRFLFIPVLEDPVDNVSIDKVSVPRKLLRPGEVIRVGVTVTNHSRSSEASFPLEVLVGGKRKAEKQVNLSPASTADFTFALSMTRWGRYRCVVRKSRDRLPADDERLFLLDVSRSVPVLVVRGRPPDSGAGRGGDYYVARALNPRREREGEFDVRVVDERRLALSDLPRKGVVVWVEPSWREPKRTAILEEYVEGGGGLVVFASQPPPAGAGRRIARFLGAASLRAAQAEGGLAPGLFRKDHPLFELFDEEELELLSRARIAQYLSASGVDPDSVLAYLGGSEPFVWEAARGKGKILVFASSPDLDHGDLPLSPMFLPVLHTAASYLAGAVSSGVHEEIHVGSPVIFEVSPAVAALVPSLIVAKDGRYAGAPEVVAENGGGARLLFTGTSSRGFYALSRDTTVIDEVAVNLDPRESGMIPLPLERLVKDNVAVVRPGAVPARRIREAREGREVFTLFLLLGILSLALESILGRRA